MELFSENHFGIIILKDDAEEKKQMGVEKVGKQMYILQDLPLESGKKLDLVLAMNKKHIKVMKKEIIATCNTYLRGNLRKETGLAPKTKGDGMLIGMDMARAISRVYPDTMVLFVADDCQLKEVKGPVIENIKMGGINFLAL